MFGILNNLMFHIESGAKKFEDSMIELNNVTKEWVEKSKREKPLKDLSYYIGIYEESLDIENDFKKFVPNFSFEEYVKNGNHIKDISNLDFFSQEHFERDIYNSIKNRENIEITIRKLASELYDEKVAILEINKIKEHL